MPAPPLAEVVSGWYAVAARDLPWRRPGTTPWAVLVSEFMLQQTPVARVLPAYVAWLDRWPTAAGLAADEPGDAVRMWGRLGYPRRALRLHAAAVAIVDEHGGEVPVTVPALLALPGVGAYTARAVAAFAHRQRHPVVDTNVRRVVARVIEGVADAAVTARDLVVVADLLPEDGEAAATASIALMELGALVCTARAPRCDICPLAAQCAWLARDRPPLDAPVKRPQPYAGTDRQVRGRLLAVLREAAEPVPVEALAEAWGEAVQRQRALDGLIADGLVDPLPDGRMSLPTRAARPGS
ncbi:MAG: HhH-GPD [Frankiales bacterium]|jgi:A/G-specific adenine glycosylase|nr:HhH-GPD [Frankiales bacterium]